jgi:hypothetical protein
MKILANITRIIHYLVILCVLIGHSIIHVKYLKYYLLFIIFIFLDWNDYDGQCILTKLEYYFLTGNVSTKTPLENGPEFFRPIVNKIFNLNLTRYEGNRLNNFIFLICWLIGFLRLCPYIKT